MKKELNRTWLLENAGMPIRYNLIDDSKDIKMFLQNTEVSNWLSRLSERSKDNNIGDIHGSHDYRMENILGKCWILGLAKSVDVFAENIIFIQKYCFLPLPGFFEDDAVKHIAGQRLEILYNFTKQKCYDIYVDGAKLKGVKKE